MVLQRRFAHALIVGMMSCAMAACGGASDADAADALSQSVVSNTFDAAALGVGDTVAGLVVTKFAMQPALALPDSPYVGDVQFRGEVHLDGSLMAHPDPEHRASCFEADSASAGRIPRMRGDDRRAWFCFRNYEEAIMMLDTLQVPARVRVTIDDYYLHYSFSDGYNTARLKAVTEIGGTR